VKAIAALFLLLTLGGRLFSQVFINEVMFAPDGDEPEWLELYNGSEVAEILISWTISDAVTTKNLPEITIQPNSYLVICKDTNALKSTRILPRGAALCQTPLPTFNNTTESIVIRNSEQITIDSVYYNGSWGKTGKSLERIDCNKNAFEADNWSCSSSIAGATPCEINSVTAVEFDVAAIAAALHPGNNFEFIIGNVGLKPLIDAGFTLFWASTAETITAQDNVFISENGITLQSSETFIKTISNQEITSFIGGGNNFYYCLVAASASNQRASNDTLQGAISFSPDYATIQINEFMYDPDSNGAEFIELYNDNDFPVNLAGYYLHDRAGKNGYDSVLIDKAFIIEPHAYAVIAWSSYFFEKYPYLLDSPVVFFKKATMNLNNDGDDIAFVDANGIPQDTLSYLPNWHLKLLTKTKGISLEKIDISYNSNAKSSWTSCGASAGATPAARNSVSLDNKSESMLSAEPNPFSPFEGSRKPICSISYKLPFGKAVATAKVFRTDGAEVITLLNSEEISSDGSFQWDGRNRDGWTLPLGAYIIVFEANDAAGNGSISEKILIVIGK